MNPSCLRHAPRTLLASFSMRFCLLCTLLLVFLTNNNGLVSAKVISGDFRLSGLEPTFVLTSFAVVPAGARVSVNLTSSKMYENERWLKLRLYRDVEWPSVKKEPMCNNQARFAKQAFSLNFEYINKMWRAEEKKAYIFNNNAQEDRPHYWYAVIDDCSLEQVMHDNEIPEIHFEMTIQNHLDRIDGNQRHAAGINVPLTHLSADEIPTIRVHMLTLALSSLVAAFLGMAILKRMFGKQRQVHAALVVVDLAAGLDAASSLAELAHLQIYKTNGIGSYMLDALSAHLEALCDGLLMILFLAIASGWTLPSHMLAVNPSQSAVQSIISDLSRPLSVGSRGGVLSGIILLTHTILAQWGRIYNDDFESYHDLEHLPGRILLFLRVLLGILCLAATLQTQWKTTSPSLRLFYQRWALLSLGWFQSMPLIDLFCIVLVPYYRRHPVMVNSSALAQSCALGLLAWLVTSESSQYHRVSRLNASNNNGDASFNDVGGGLGTSALAPAADTNGHASNGAAAAPKKTWTFGKSKVRLD